MTAEELKAQLEAQLFAKEGEKENASESSQDSQKSKIKHGILPSDFVFLKGNEAVYSFNSELDQQVDKETKSMNQNVQAFLKFLTMDGQYDPLDFSVEELTPEVKILSKEGDDCGVTLKINLVTAKDQEEDTLLDL